jgi:Acyl-coenzyme A:6-aminopenicillanic acid acyl-transferase
MKLRVAMLFLLILLSLSACRTPAQAPPVAGNAPIRAMPGLNTDQIRTLGSLRKVDAYPLYTMTYYGGYKVLGSQVAVPSRVAANGGHWACSLFAAFGNPQHAVYGRNFDWQFSPSLLLFTHPPDGFASVSMVDITYLGFGSNDVAALSTSSKRANLLNAPLLPFDGMNEYGLTVGMAAVPDAKEPIDAHKPTVGSLRIIRLMLDHARNTGEAIALLQAYNIDFRGGPSLHYLIADPSGHAATVELKDRAVEVVRNSVPWQITTNFYLAGASDAVKAGDWRYNTANTWLQAKQGSITPENAMQLLARVRQTITQWSIVYDMSTGQVSAAMLQAYGNVHTFHLSLQS